MQSSAMRLGHNSSVVRSIEPLTDDQIRRVAPSIFAGEKHLSRSERYAYIPTSTALTALRQEGYEAYMVSQSRSYNPTMSSHTKHMMRLRRPGVLSKGEGFNEVIIVNSHNGTSQWQMMAGHFVLVCLNGLVTGDANSNVAIRHSGSDPLGRVIEGVYSVVGQFAELDEHRESMKALTLSENEINEFARQALAIKYPVGATPFDAKELLVPRRHDDADSSLWSVYNRVQENMIKGGLHGRNASGRRISTREIVNIDKNIKFNKDLWQLAREAQVGQFEPLPEIVLN